MPAARNKFPAASMQDMNSSWRRHSPVQEEKGSEEVTNRKSISIESLFAQQHLEDLKNRCTKGQMRPRVETSRNHTCQVKVMVFDSRKHIVPFETTFNCPNISPNRDSNVLIADDIILSQAMPLKGSLVMKITANNSTEEFEARFSLGASKVVHMFPRSPCFDGEAKLEVSYFESEQVWKLSRVDVQFDIMERCGIEIDPAVLSVRSKSPASDCSSCLEESKAEPVSATETLEESPGEFAPSLEQYPYTEYPQDPNLLNMMMQQPLNPHVYNLVESQYPVYSEDPYRMQSEQQHYAQMMHFQMQAVPYMVHAYHMQEHRVSCEQYIDYRIQEIVNLIHPNSTLVDMLKSSSTDGDWLRLRIEDELNCITRNGNIEEDDFVWWILKVVQLQLPILMLDRAASKFFWSLMRASTPVQRCYVIDQIDSSLPMLFAWGILASHGFKELLENLDLVSFRHLFRAIETNFADVTEIVCNSKGVQWVIDVVTQYQKLCGEDVCLESFLKSLFPQNKALYLSCNKFSSGLLLKMFEIRPKMVAYILDQLVLDNAIILSMHHSVGYAVLQYCLTSVFLGDKLRSTVLDIVLKQSLTTLARHQIGSKFVSLLLDDEKYREQVTTQLFNINDDSNRFVSLLLNTTSSPLLLKMAALESPSRSDIISKVTPFLDVIPSEIQSQWRTTLDV